MEYIVVDWTDYDADIAAFLARFGRKGSEPEILPQLLTPGIVLDALERAGAPILAER